MSTTTENCCECSECLAIQTDDQDQVRYLFLSHINHQRDATCSTCLCIEESPVNYAFDISAASDGEGPIKDAWKTLTNMTDNKARLGSARQAAEKLRSGSESQAACSKLPGVNAKNRSPSARAATSRSAGTTATHDVVTVPRARGANAEAPITCKCRERAAEIKLSKLKKVNGCRNNCAGNDRSGSRSRSQSAASASSRDSESRQKKASCAPNSEKRTDRNSMDARPARKLASSRAGAGIKEITSPRSSKLTSKSELTDIGVQDRTMSKQSAVKPVDGQGRLKITRPRSGGHKPDPRVRAAKEGCSTDRSDVSSSSCAARKSPSPREKSAEPSKDTVRTKGSLVKGDKTEPSSNKPTSKVSPRNNPLLVKATSSTRNITAGGKKLSPRAESSQSGICQSPDSSKSPGDAQKSVPRYCSGSTVSSRNKSVRLTKTGSPRETGVETNSKRDQSVSDTSASGKSYSSRKSIPGTQNCKINSAKPARIINKSKCSKSSSASKTKSEDAGHACDSIDLLTASPAADEIQNSNSNCDSASDAAIKTSDKLPVTETPGDTELSEKRGSGDSLGWDVYPEEFGDSKDGADKGDSVSGRGSINTSVDPSAERLVKSRGKGLSSQGTNCEARYAGHPVASAKNPEQKRQSKVTARSKALGISAGISRQSTLSNGTSDDVDPKIRDACEGTAVTSSTSSKSKCVVGKRKPDGMRTGKLLSSESGRGSVEANNNRHAKVAITKPTTLTSGLEKASTSGQWASCIPKPSKGSAPKGVAPQGTQSHPDPSRTQTVAAEDGGDTETKRVQSDHGPRKKASATPSSSLLLTQGCDKLNVNTAPSQQLDLDSERLRSNTHIFPTVSDKTESRVSQVEASEAVQKPQCEVRPESGGYLNECNNHKLSEMQRANIMPQERDNKITIAQGSLCKHRTTSTSNGMKHFPVEKPMLAKNDNGKQSCDDNPGSFVCEGACSEQGPFVSVDTHLLTQSTADGASESETPAEIHRKPYRETEARVKEGFIENRRSEERVLRNNITTETQDKHCTNITGHHGEKIVTTGTSLHIRLASSKEQEKTMDDTGSKQRGEVVNCPSHFKGESGSTTPAKLNSVSVSCLNWNPKHACVEEKPRVLSEAAVVSTPKLERSAICFTPSVRTKLIPTTVKLNNLCSVLNISTAEGSVDGAEEANVQIPKQSTCEGPSGNARLNDLTSEVQSDFNSNPTSNPTAPKVTQIQCQVEAPKCSRNSIQQCSATHGSCEATEKTRKIIEINTGQSDNITGIAQRTKVVRKIPVFSGNLSSESGANSKNSADIVIRCNGNCSVEVEVKRPKSKSAQKVQAKRMVYDVDYSSKKKQSQTKTLPKELSKSNPDLREQTNTVTVEVTKFEPNTKRKRLPSEKSALLKNSANKELSKSSPNLANADGSMNKAVSPRHNPLKGKNFRKNLVYSGLVKKIAVINTPMKNRVKSNPDITKDLEIFHLDKDNDAKCHVPTKSPRPKTGTVRKIKAKKASLDSPKYQTLSKQKSKSTPDLRDFLGGCKSPVPTLDMLQGNAMCGNLVKTNYNKMNIMKFSANFYSDISADQDDSEVSVNSGERCCIGLQTDDGSLEENCAQSDTSSSQKLKALPKKKIDFETPDGDLISQSAVSREVLSQPALELTQDKGTTGEQDNSAKSQIPTVKTSQLKILTSLKSFSHLRNDTPKTGRPTQISTVNVDLVSRSPNAAERVDDRVTCSDSSEMNKTSEAVISCAENKEHQVIRDLDPHATQLSQVTFDPICTSTGEFQPFDIAKLEQEICTGDKVTERYAISERKILLGSKPEESSHLMQVQQPNVLSCAQNDKDSDFVLISREIVEAPTNSTNAETVPSIHCSMKSKKVGPKVSPKSKKKMNHDGLSSSKLEDANCGTQTDLSPASDKSCEECTDVQVSSAPHLPLSEPDLQVFGSSLGASPSDVEQRNGEIEKKTEDDLFYNYESEHAEYTEQTLKSANPQTLKSANPQTLPRVSGRYTEAQLRKIRSEGKSLLEKRSRVPKGLVEDTVNVLATHLEGLLQDNPAGCEANAQHVEPTHSKVANSGESKVNFLKKRFESEQSNQDFRKQRAIERSRVQKKKIPRPLSVQIMDTCEGQQKLDIGSGRHSVVMSTSTDSSVSRDSGFPTDRECMSIEFMRPTEWRERPVSMTDSDMTSGSEMQCADYLMFENPEGDVLDEALMSPNPDVSLGVDAVTLRQVDSEFVESSYDQNANDILPENKAEKFLCTIVTDTEDVISDFNDVNSNFLNVELHGTELSDTQNQDNAFLAQRSELTYPDMAPENLCAKDVATEFVSFQESQGYSPHPDICVYRAQRVELSMDNNSNFMESSSIIEPPEFPERTIRLTEGENHVSEADNCSKCMTDEECEVRLRPKTKPKCKFNRISSTISIFEGHNVNGSSSANRFSAAVDVDSNSNLRQHRLRPCESESKRTEADKRNGVIVLESRHNTLSDFEKSRNHHAKQQSQHDLTTRENPSQLEEGQDNTSRAEDSEQLFQNERGNASDYKCKEDQILAGSIYPINTAHVADDGEVNLKFQNFGQSPKDCDYQCTDPDLKSIAKKQLLSGDGAAGSHSANHSQEIFGEGNSQEGDRIVGIESKPPRSVKDDTQPMSLERCGSGLEKATDDSQCIESDAEECCKVGRVKVYDEPTCKGMDLPNTTHANVAEGQPNNKNVAVIQVTELQSKPRRYKSPARDSNSFVTPARYQTREARAQTREVRTQLRRSRSHSRESTERSHGDNGQQSVSPVRQSRSHSRSSRSSVRNSPTLQTRKSRSHSRETNNAEGERQESEEICPNKATRKKATEVQTNVTGTDICPTEDQVKPQPSCRKSHSFSEVLSKVHSNIDYQFIPKDQSSIEPNSMSESPKTKEPPVVAKKPKHRLRGSQSPSRKSPPNTQNASETAKGIAETCPNICSESPSRELRAFSQSPTMASQPNQSGVEKTPTPAVPPIKVEWQYQSTRLPGSCEQKHKTDSVTSTPQKVQPKLQRGRMTKRMKSPVRDIFPNKLSVAVMDNTRLAALSPERREAERLYERALAELSFDQGEEDENDTTLIATSENSSSPFYTPSASRAEPGFESPRTRLRRSASLPTADFTQDNEAYVNGLGSRSPRIIVNANEGDDDDDDLCEPDMGHTPFATPEWSPDSSSVQKRRNLNAASQNEGFFTPARPSSYQNAMATALLSPGEDPWSPFTGPVHHIVLPRQQSMVDIPFNCPEEYIDDDQEALKYHTIGRCQTSLMAECPRLQRNPSFYAAQKKAIPLAVSAASHVSSPIWEEQSSYDDEVFTSSGSSDRSFEKTREAKSPGIIKRMLRRHRSFNDRDKDRKDVGNTSGSKDQSFFKFPALKSILRRGSKDLIKLAETQKDNESVHNDQNNVEQAPLAKFQRDSDIESVPGSPYASSRRLRRSLTAGELTGFRGEKRASLVDQIPVKYNTFMCSDDDNDNENDSISIQSLNASPIHSPTPCPPLPSRQKPYSRSSSFSVHFTDQSHTEEYSDSDKPPSSGECVPMDPLRNHFLHRDVTSSNSNDSGIQNDSSTHSSNESLKGQQVIRREMSRRHHERPKSDCSVRWAHNLDTSAEEDGLDSRQLRPRRPRTERTNSDLGDLTTLTMAVQQFNQLTKMPHSLSMKNIRRKKFIDGECGGKSRRMSTPHPIKSRQEKPRPDTAKKATLHRSLSMPVNLDKLRRRKRITSFFGFDESGNYCSPDHYSDDSSDESENSMEIGVKDKCHSTRASHVALTSITEKPYEECLTYAEALWDHVTMDPEELGFRAGDVIEVTDTADKDWWWGAVDDREGWFPAAFVRLRANQGQLEEEEVLAQPIESMHTAFPSPEPSRRLTSTGGVSREQARTNVINEILQAEKDYVKHLHDVIEGYIHQARRHPAMFSENRIRILFGNLEDIYNVSKQFVTDLEKSYNSGLPHLTEVGQCFLNSKKDFEIYSDYCNNHPDACKELQELYRNKRYRHFFEACRLLQEMIQIPLEGFLLTPVQKICKYPLQLSELLKFTDPDHSDYDNVCQALDAMKRIACLINERKRKMESIAKISAWQQSVEDWEGSDLLELSSELITSGEAHKINRSGRSQERTLFLFDHQLIYCKKDLLRRNGFCYKGRVLLDHCDLIMLPDGKDLQYNVNVKNGWKLHDKSQDKWFLFSSKTPAEREKWIRAFSQERQQVKEDKKMHYH
ncbi:LOW QUALITY PROTEIN: uncharacterized protein LOC135479839 [Liolophura sinensis]|uniref:LOW QUALITY PROTEIN: uncharacterized protein LOC135479839 n=1 Tax=Liolophura sinensis TaxID=3198878 RepID=UPI00315946FD